MRYIRNTMAITTFMMLAMMGSTSPASAASTTVGGVTVDVSSACVDANGVTRLEVSVVNTNATTETVHLRTPGFTQIITLAPGQSYSTTMGATLRKSAKSVTVQVQVDDTIGSVVYSEDRRFSSC